MATDHSNYDPLRNPQVDYERADLSPAGILWFLIGLFIAAVFIELVIWGMFHFMARSEALFPQGNPNPMMSAQKAAPAETPHSILQNTPPVNLSVFPEPRLQANDAGEMGQFMDSEQKLLNAPQPFTDASGTVHLPIALAMKLVEERGLPVRPSSPPDIAGQTATSGGAPVASEPGASNGPGAEPKQP
jgi:hypothetical protein